MSLVRRVINVEVISSFRLSSDDGGPLMIVARYRLVDDVLRFRLRLSDGLVRPSFSIREEGSKSEGTREETGKVARQRTSGQRGDRRVD